MRLMMNWWPNLLYNLPPEERANMAQAMPPVVLEEMVPVVWKDKWPAFGVHSFVPASGRGANLSVGIES